MLGRRPTVPRRTTAMRTSIGPPPTIIGIEPPRRATHVKKGKPEGFPYELLCRLGSDAELRVCFRGDAHRKSGVYQLWFSSKPGGVMLPPELKELWPHVYS